MYIGHTGDLQCRLEKHNNNESGFTKFKGPWEVVYTETFSTRSEAMIREKYYKSGSGYRRLEELV